MQIRWCWAGLVAAVLGCSDEATHEGNSPPASPPNFVVIMTDDQQAGTLQYMPRVTQDLINHGATFDNAFVTSPLCAPSRATFLTGRYAHNHGVVDNTVSDSGGFGTFYANGAESKTLPVWLSNGGYRTALVGKYLNGYPGTAPKNYIPPGWSDWRSIIFREKYYDYKLNENGAIVPYSTAPTDYQTDVIRNLALTVLAESHASGAPFFVLVTPMAPHQPSTPAPRHLGMFAGAQAPRTPNFNEADVSDKAPPLNGLPPLDAGTIATIDATYASRLETLQAVDEMVGAIVDSLAHYGILDNTYVIFTSDNGFHMGNHRLAFGKGQPYDEDLRVPLVIRGPGIPIGHISEMVLNTDLAPTIGAWAGVVVPSYVDGRSLAGLASSGGAAKWRQAFLAELGGKFTETRAASHSFLKLNQGFEYYDMVGDPFQLVNIEPNLKPARELKLRKATTALSSCAAATCRTLEATEP